MQTVWMSSYQETPVAVSYNKNALLLQVVGGSVAVVSRTLMANIPEGQAHSDDISPEDRGCFGHPQRDQTSL